MIIRREDCHRLSIYLLMMYRSISDCLLRCFKDVCCFDIFKLPVFILLNGRSSLTNEKDHHYFLNRFVCVGEFFDG